MYVDPVKIIITQGSNANNVSLNINPSESHIIHLLYRIWDIPDIIKAEIYLPFNWAKIFFDRNNIKSKFYHSVLTKKKKTDGIWNLFNDD